jgi:hypothetical protein
MKEQLSAGFRRIARIEQLETPEEAKQNRAQYLDTLEQHLSLPPDILNGFLEEETGGEIIWTSQTYRNWKFLDKDLGKNNYKVDQESIFLKILYSGTDFIKRFDSRPENYIDEYGIPTLSNGYKCRVDKIIPSNRDLILGNKVKVPLKRRNERSPKENYIFCPLSDQESNGTLEIVMEREIPYTLERAERDIQQPDTLLR